MLFLQIIFILVCITVPAFVILLVTLRYLPSTRNMYNSIHGQSSDRGYWGVDLQNMSNGRIFRKIFSHQLVIGRTISDEDRTGMLSIGTESYISRKQCSFTATSYGVVLANLSEANSTSYNGHILLQPTYIKVGDEISVGYNRYRIISLYRMA